MSSIKEISEKTGYSTATVSRALDPRYRDKVKLASREKIMALCDQYRYRPRFSARALASGKTHTIGLISTDAVRSGFSPNYGVLIKTLIRELKERDYVLSILPVRDSSELIDEAILQTFASSRVDGFILPASMIRNSTLRELAERRFPVATFFMPSEHVSGNLPVANIHVENDGAYRELFGHLKRQGRTHPVFMGVVQGICSRTRQCLDAARATGLEMEESDIFLLPARLKRNELVYSTYKAIKKHWERLSVYDSWIMSNDLMAYAAAEACRDAGVAVGGDIAIAGYDNISDIFNYEDEMSQLTTIDPKLERLGRLVIQSLFQQIEQREGACAQITVQSELKIRNSTRQEML